MLPFDIFQIEFPFPAIAGKKNLKKIKKMKKKLDRWAII
jgi:hypothetical protein